MIGFYNYTIVLTFLSLVSSVFGITQAIDGKFRMAIFCLAFSGLCDTFDGKVARTKKDRTDNEKLFGRQLDSMCDIVCFGAFPAAICYLLGVRHALGGIAIAYYCICSVIRLSYYNVLETNRHYGNEAGEKVYHGLPITSIAVILPLTFLLNFMIPEKIFPIVLGVMLFVVGTCFIVDFKIKRPNGVIIGVLIAIVSVAVGMIFLFSKYHIIRPPVRQEPIIEKITEDFIDGDELP